MAFGAQEALALGLAAALKPAIGPLWRASKRGVKKLFTTASRKSGSNRTSRADATADASQIIDITPTSSRFS